MHRGASVFYIPSDGTDWAKYVAQKLEDYNIKCKIFNFTDTNHFEISSHVNVFIITPDFLEFTDWTVFKHVDINKCMLILTGSEQCDLEEASRRYGCAQVANCAMHENTGSEESVKEMMIRIILMYEGELITSPSANSSPAPSPHWFDHSPSDPGADRDSGDYDVLPAYTRQLNCLHEVFYKENTLYLVLDRRAERKLEIVMGEETLTPTFSEYAVYTVQLSNKQKGREDDTCKEVFSLTFSEYAVYTVQLSNKQKGREDGTCKEVFSLTFSEYAVYTVQLSNKQKGSEDGTCNKVFSLIFSEYAVYTVQLSIKQKGREDDTCKEVFSLTFSEYAVYTVQLSNKQKDPTACSVSVYQDDQSIGERKVSRLYNDHKQAFDADVDESRRRLASLHKSTLDQSNTLVSVSTQTDNLVNVSESFSDHDNVFIENVTKQTDSNGNRKKSDKNVQSYVKDDNDNNRDTLKANDDDCFESDKLELLRQLLEDVTSPEQLLCQCFGIADSDCTLLDEKMTSLIESANAFPGLTYPVNNEEFHQSVWPTLLHFGARFNLIRFCDALLSNPMMYDVVNRRNKDGQRPVDIARSHEHCELANMLESFAEKLHTSPDNKYDSGVSELSLERTRISTRLMSEKDAPALPPKPHTFSRPHDGYANVAGETGDEGIPIIITDDIHEHDAKTSLVFSNTESGKSKHHITEKSPKSSPVSVEVWGAIDGVSDYVKYHRKDLSAHLGMTTPPPQKKKSKGLSKLFGRVRGGSGKAEAPSSTPKLNNSKGIMKRYKREDSKRSSDTSSSTGSTHSDISQRDDDDNVPVLRHSDINTEESDGNLLSIVANSKHRKSMRVSKALRDQHRDGPSLPVKKVATDGQVF
ncbi:hypothetical protein DPMN_031055 [Dreissena polymorpha]|uniref:Phosphoinositide 3-kinase adapter protein 1 n=1 Tax=Dreissena polymorpha TaxID=45954 RepID=A0A9D4M1V6_DREPO|nr:hypothetical protein DPMN_031055 [Dreissena polymorpha]